MRGKMGSLQTYKDGQAAEVKAMLYLLLKGYWPLARRFKTPVGEIDIITRRGRTLVFVEVKKRANHDTAAASIGPENAARVRRAAEWWLKSHTAVADKCDIRFDAVTVADYCHIKHIPNAF
ncbi:MAG: YraN family protein [Alphaproteobacteria bacterium]|nr:YraN family protein [Alphaproteobacteria bacterium]